MRTEAWLVPDVRRAISGAFEIEVNQAKIIPAHPTTGSNSGI